MICSQSNPQFLATLLQMRPSNIKQLLRKNDQSHIITKKHTILKNMPQDLKPNIAVDTRLVQALKGITQANVVMPGEGELARLERFPSTFHENTKVHHWRRVVEGGERLGGGEGRGEQGVGVDIKGTGDIQEVRQGGKGQDLLQQGLVKVMGKEVDADKQQQLRVQSVIKSEMPLTLGLIKTQQQQKPLPYTMPNPTTTPPPPNHPSHQADNEHSQQQNPSIYSLNQPTSQLPAPLSNPFTPPHHPSKHSQFISNKQNFLDFHTNKKPIQQNYITPETYSMNMLQYAHNQKRENVFGDAYSYPNVIMGGSGTGWMKTSQSIRENPFKNTFVSGPKYTLNEYDAPTHIKEQSETLMNPHTHDPRSNPRMQSDMQFRQNVQDVLKYTLGDKRFTNTMADRHNDLARSVNMKSSSNVLESSFQQRVPVQKERVLENPFVRRPASTYKY